MAEWKHEHTLQRIRQMHAYAIAARDPGGRLPEMPYVCIECSKPWPCMTYLLADMNWQPGDSPTPRLTPDGVRG